VPVHPPQVGIGISKEAVWLTVTKARARAANRNIFFNIEVILFPKSVRRMAYED
jgi:hypothetical protein